MNRMVLFRWLALIPVTFLVTGISTGLFMYVLVEHIKPFSHGAESDALYLGIFTSFASIFWLLTSYFIAPDHKKIILWIFYILGILFTLLIFSEIRIRNELQYTIALSTPLLIGFICSISLHFGKELLNEIER